MKKQMSKFQRDRHKRSEAIVYDFMLMRECYDRIQPLYARLALKYHCHQITIERTLEEYGLNGRKGLYVKRNKRDM